MSHRLMAVNATGLASGAERVLARALEWVLDEGWTAVCVAPEGPLSDLLPSGVERVEIPDLKLSAGPRATAVVRAAATGRRASRVVRRASAGADVVLVNSMHALPALRLARLGVPTAWLVHDVAHRRSWRRLIRHSASAVDLAIAVSDAVAAPLVELGLEVRVVRNGTPWPVPAAPADHPAPAVVGCAALLTSWKGQDVLLEAAALLADARVEVELAGGSFPKDDAYVADLRRRAEQPDLVGRVHLLGNVADVASRMATWTVAVLPSTDPEAAPLSLLEYMSHGVPAVATDHGGAPEVLGEAGLLVPPRDPCALAAAIQALLDDGELRASCAAAGRDQVRDHLTLEHQRSELVGALDQLVDGDGRVRS